MRENQTDISFYCWLLRGKKKARNQESSKNMLAENNKKQQKINTIL